MGDDRLLSEHVAELLAEAHEEEAQAVDAYLEAIAVGRPLPDADTVGFNLPTMQSWSAEADSDVARRTIANLVLRVRVVNRRLWRLRAVARAAVDGRVADLPSAIAALRPGDLEDRD
ncbi:MAG TPA: hypothetical protein VFP65_06470 [Anaeromyxobacteraceae bacterium]|nr:hypothetical protein [Anaeromyxobacteraceae bacterium]